MHEAAENRFHLHTTGGKAFIQMPYVTVHQSKSLSLPVLLLEGLYVDLFAHVQGFFWSLSNVHQIFCQKCVFSRSGFASHAYTASAPIPAERALPSTPCHCAGSPDALWVLFPPL